MGYRELEHNHATAERWRLPGRPERLVFAACGALLVMNGATYKTLAQADSDFLSRTAPAPPYRSPQSTDYNLKWGDVTGRFSGSVLSEFNDNINLSQSNRKADFSIGPEVGFGLLWPISHANVLQLDFSAGYRWYANSPSISTFVISPKSNSHIDYYLYIHDVRINLHDNFAVQVDPTDVGQISGGGTSLLNFRRIINTSGLTADWRATKSLTLFAGYDYTLDRSLSGQFQQLDRDDHAFSVGFNSVLSPRVTAGVSASYTISQYVQNIQNDGNGFSIGPHVTYKATSFLTLDASVGYSLSTYDSSGTIADTSSFNGLTYSFGAKHQINKRTAQQLRVSDSVGIGVGSNFTEVFSVQYNLSHSFSSSVTVNALVAYENLSGSSVLVDQADRYLLSLGTALKIAPRWTLGVGYALAFKNSNLPGRDYVQNRLTLDFTHQF